MTANEELILASSNVVVALLNVGLLEISRVDAAISSLVMNHNVRGIEILSEVMDQTLFTDEPSALRADFANSLVAMSAWVKEQSDLPLASQISARLRAHGMPQFVSVEVTDKAKAKQDQMRYVFDEWVRIFESLGQNDSTCAAFLKELHREQTINSTEDLAEFFQLCIDTCIDCFNHEAQSPRGSVEVAFGPMDALSRLIIMLVKFQGETNGAVRISKAPYLETVLTTIVLVLNHHQNMRGVAFPQRLFHRMLTNLLYEYSSARLDSTVEHNDMMSAFATCLKSLQPSWFPGFTYAWCSLIVHRVFVAGMLRPNHQAGWGMYRELVGSLLHHISELSQTVGLDLLTLDFYKGVLKNILVLLHDYPEFLCQNHSYFCSRIAYGIPQLRNLILTAKPSAYHDLPDPMTPGLKVERLEEMKKHPILAGDFDYPLLQAELKDIIQGVVRKSGDHEVALKQIKAALLEGQAQLTPIGPPKSVEIINALVPFVGQDALINSPGRFDASSSPVIFMTKLALSLGHEARYQFLNAIADQIRYPSTHTDFFCKLMLHLWGAGSIDEQQGELRVQISRVVYERLTVARPHVWGMTILFLELQQNSSYGFWESLAPDSNTQQRLQQAMRTAH